MRHDRAKVLYVCKGGYVVDPELRRWGLADRYSPLEAFDVGSDHAQTEAARRRARVVKDYRSGAVAMPSGICSNALAEAAITAVMRKLVILANALVRDDRLWTPKAA